MGNYSIPEDIRALKPKGSVVKLISGNYYVYEQKHIKDETSGKWKIKSGKYLGKITRENGYIPVETSYLLEEDSVLEFGNYAFAYMLGDSLKEKLETVFDKETTSKLYVLSILHLVNGFSYIYQISSLFDQSFFKLIYPNFKFGEVGLTNLYSMLGRKKKSVEKFQKILYQDSKTIAIDGHCIASSLNNDLARKGNKAVKFVNNQVNLIMGYSIDSGAPVFAEVVTGDTLDSVSLESVLSSKDIKNTLFVVDKGYYSLENLKLLTKNNCHYVMPPKENSKIYKDFIAKVNYTKEHFVYKTKTTKTVIYYDYEKVDDDYFIYSFRDLSQHAIECDDYESKIKLGKENYTIEKYNEVKEKFGTITLICDYEMKPEEVFTSYKNRWKIETYYNYLKNNLEFDAFHCQDYYVEQGLSFIILLTSNLHYELAKKVDKTGFNLDHILLDLRSIKLKNTNELWQATSSTKKRIELFNNLNTDLPKLIARVNELYKATKS